MKSGQVYPVIRHDKFVHTDLCEMTKEELKEVLDSLGYGQVKMIVTQLVQTIKNFTECD